MTVGALRAELLIHGARSLKEKRQVLKSLKDRIRNGFNVSVAEVGYQDLWQRAALAFAVAGTDGAYVRGVLDELVRFIAREARVELARHESEICELGSGE